jgi:hypothetical protein
MEIEICKWFNNADSPVLLMIDDFANVWVDTNRNGQIDLGEDWGYGKNSVNSSFRYLTEVVLKDFPQVKVTFFTPVGVRVGMVENPIIKSISKYIHCDETTKRFFRMIHENSKYEIAYHGTTHGKVGKTNLDFIQEWDQFASIDEAIKKIESGKDIYKEVFGHYPKGGKYCGYHPGKYGDDSINKTGFSWWCRYWNRGLIEDKSCLIGGNDHNPLTNFDIKIFGNNQVVDIPSTVSGSHFNGTLNTDCFSVKGYIKKVLKPILLKKKYDELNYLLDNKLVINIQEHIAPSRDDGRRQSPSIFDDLGSLRIIFNFLKDKNVWYCTGTELAQYFILRESLKFVTFKDDFFSIENTSEDISGQITIKIMPDKNYIIIQPDGTKVLKNNDAYNIEVFPGDYKICLC